MKIKFHKTKAKPKTEPVRASVAPGIEYTAKGDQWIRRTTTAVVVGIAGFSGFISYRHAYELAHGHGEDAGSAWALPLTIDGLIFSASMVILRANRHRVPVPKMAWFAMGLGILATLGANVAHGVPYGPMGMATSSWPAIALVVSFEMLMRLFKPVQADVDPEPVQDTPVAVVEPEKPAQPLPEWVKGLIEVEPLDYDPHTVPKPRPAEGRKPKPAPKPETTVEPDERYAIGLHAFHVSKLGPGRPLSQRDLAGVMGLKNRDLAIQIQKDYAEAVEAGNLAALLAANLPPTGTVERPTAPIETGEESVLVNAVPAEA